MKAISIRLEDGLGRQFDELCRKSGYKKNTLLTRLIASFVRHQKALLSNKRTQDPFAGVIGLLHMEPFLGADETIDKVIYDL